MPEPKIHLQQLLSNLDSSVDVFVDKVKSVWTYADEKDEFPSELISFLHEAEPALLEYIEQLDQLLCFLDYGKNSYVMRSNGDWRSRRPNL